MNTCWKCGNVLRNPTAAFCPACGSALKPMDPSSPAGANPWQARLAAAERTSPAKQLLWLLIFPLAPVTFPLLLAAATRQLRRHVRQRLAAPAFASARFSQSPEGQQVTRRLATSVGKLNSFAVWPAVLSLLLVAILAGILFIAPTCVPAGIRYGNALSAMLDGRDACGYVSVSSREDYEQVWSRLYDWAYSHIDVWAMQRDSSNPLSSPKGSSSLAVWDTTQRDTLANHRPYEYVANDPSYGRPGTYRVISISLYSDATRVPGVVLGLGALLLYGWYVLLGVQYWRRFARHAAAEALAAGYARGDTAFHDQLLRGVHLRNRGLAAVGIMMAVIGLQLFLFPLLAALALLRHERLEQSSGIATALGLSQP